MLANEEYMIVTRSHLLKMAVLAERAVDYALKAYELRDPRYAHQVHKTERNLRELQRVIAERGRSLLRANPGAEGDTVIASCTLQIFSSLRITFSAAKEIAHSVSLEQSRCRQQSNVPWREAAGFANNLVGMNLVALLNGETRLAELVLEAKGLWEWSGRAQLITCSDEIRFSPDALPFEDSVACCLREIIDQSFAIARALVRWRHSEVCTDGATVRTLNRRVQEPAPASLPDHRAPAPHGLPTAQ